MPVKTDTSGQRRVEMELLLPGSPEQLWQAMATGPGNSAWFTKTTLEERVGGTLRFEFGPGMASSGEITAWEPPARLAYVEREWAEGAPPVATELTIHARSGGRCVVRMVHSLFAAGDDWDDQLEGFENGWPVFFAVLRLYCMHFAGQPGVSFQALAPVAGDMRAAWKRLSTGLGSAGADAGDECRFGPPAAARPGTVEVVKQDAGTRWAVVRGADAVAAFGVFGDAGGSAHASVSLYSYGADAQARSAAAEAPWRAWMAETFPAA